jgi:hypothetical protein
MRAAALVLLLAAPAQAGVFGDAVAGVGAGERDATSTLGARGGIANDHIGGLLSVEWRYVIAGNDYEDYAEWEHRLRVIGSVVLPFEMRPGSSGGMRIGGGFEGARIVGMGYFPRRSSTVDYARGYVFEVGATFLSNVESVRLGRRARGRPLDVQRHARRPAVRRALRALAETAENKMTPAEAGVVG